MKVIILTEANKDVATGHLMEAIELGNSMKEYDWDVCLLINDDCSPKLLERVNCIYQLYEKDFKIGFRDIQDYVLKIVPDVIVTDLREVNNSFIQTLKKKYRGKIVCIDEWGHCALDCDVIINPMIDSYFWEYVSDAKKYNGAEYLILPSKIKKYHMEDKVISEQVNTIAISMGGVDAKGTTLKLIEWIPEIIPQAEINVILGAAFPYQQEIERLVTNSEVLNRIHIFCNVSNIYDYFANADIAFCAGGNTLHELACIGVPTIIIPTMPHETNNGLLFQKNGFGKCLNITDDLKKQEVILAMNELSNTKVRTQMSICGKQMCDGCGCERVMNIIRSEVR